MSTHDPAEALRERARARIGQVLREKWRVDKLLGLGGMAAVYAATHVNNGRRVAIKLLHTELSTNAEVRTRFLREGYAANKVEHPGSVAVLDDDTSEDGAAFLVMELLEGETLEDRRERSGTLPVHEVLSLTDRLLDVLAAAHDRGIVHRDIKPENVFLTRDGVVKVLDFGIARMREMSSSRMTLTSAGAIGTPAFMPPEQARGRWDDVGPQSDIWSVGATMYTLLAGRLVHSADTVNELMLAAMTKPAQPIASIVPGLSAPVAHLVDRALAYEISARWSDARAMQMALRAAYQGIAGAAQAGYPVHDGGYAPKPPAQPVFDPASVTGSIRLGADPSAVTGSIRIAPAPVSVPQPAQPAAPLSTAAAPVPSASGALATGYPVTMVGASPRKGNGAILTIVGGAVGALVVGAVLWAFVLRSPPHPASADAPASASAATSVAPTAQAEPSATATAAPSSSEAPSVADDPSAVASAAAAPSASTPTKWQKPGKFLRNPKRFHK